jgi:DMSO/TMAO reductase YedYZ heme-binding membrane subunit
MGSRGSAAIDAVLSGAVTTGALPGVVAMAANTRGTFYEGAFGSADLSEPRPMRVDAVFRIASMTKALTAVAAMQLVERGLLSLDAPASKVLPFLAGTQVLDGFDPAGAPILRAPRGIITLRNLLTHTAGYAVMSLIARTSRPGEGWQLFTLIIVPCLVASVAIPIVLPGLEGVRIVVSTTARGAAILFCLAFSASSIRRLFPSDASRWLMRNRRHVGLAFAALQTIHIMALMVFASVSLTVFAVAVGGLVIGIFGAAGYLTVVALAVTSFKPAMAALGPERWRALHRFGGYFIWFIFVFAFLLHLLHDPTLIYANLELAMLLLTVVLRHLPSHASSPNWRETAPDSAHLGVYAVAPDKLDRG